MDFMSRLEMVLSLILLVSIGINLLLFVYSRNVAQKLVLISQEIDDMRAAVAGFASHVKSVYEMEMFYGDEVLQNLIDHTNSLYDMLEDYEDVVYLTEPLTFIEENNEDDLNDSDEETFEREDLPEKDVLYAGSRRRDS